MPRPTLVLGVFLSTLLAAAPSGSAAPWDEPPRAEFAYAPQDLFAGDEVSLVSLASGPAPIILYEWTIASPSGTISMRGERALVAFPAAGAYEVTHTVTDALLRTASLARTLVVQNAPPVAQFTAEPAVAARGEAVGFADASTDRDGDAIVAWSWSFGDGATSAASAPAHAYAALGAYAVTLTVRDAAGNEASATREVRVVNRAPLVSATFTPAAPEVGEAVQFNASAIDPDGDAAGISYEWTFSDGASFSGAHVSRSFATRGSYVASVRAIDAEEGVSEPYALSFHVAAPRPVAAFEVQPIVPVVDEPASFFDTSRAAGSGIEGWSWDFGDGATSAQQHPVHTFSTPGLHQVTLTVRSTEGTTDAVAEAIRVNDPPSARFAAPASASVGELIAFADLSTDAEGPIASWAWSFADGAGSALANPTHAFAAAGTYGVRLAVTDGDGATRSTVRLVHVRNAAPVADFSVEGALVADEPVTFRSRSYDPDGAPLALAWSFGDGATSTEENPTHTYAQSGRYVVTLQVSDGEARHETSRAIRIGAAHALPIRVEAILPDGRVADPATLDQFELVLVRPEGNLSVPLAFDARGAQAELPAGAWMRGDRLVAYARDALHAPAGVALEAFPSDDVEVLTLRLALPTPVLATLDVEPGERAGLGLGGERAADGTPVYRDPTEGFHGRGTVVFADGAPAAGAEVVVQARWAGHPGWCAIATARSSADGSYQWSSAAGAPCGPAGVTPMGAYELRAVPTFAGAASVPGEPVSARVDPTATFF